MSLITPESVWQLQEALHAKAKREPALHLTRQQDLLELDLPAPDLSLYQTREGGEV